MVNCGNYTVDLDPQRAWPTLVWVVVFGTIGFFCNVMAIIAILRIPDLRKQGSTKMTASFLMSSTLSVFGLVTGIVLMHRDRDRPMEERISPYIWHLLKSSTYLFDSLHMYNTTVLSVTRLIAMFRPLLYKRLMSPRSIAGLLTLTWGLPTIMALPSYLGVIGEVDSQTFDYIRECNQFPVAEVVYLIIIFMIPGIIPIGIYVFMYVQVSLARKATRTNHASPENERKITQWKNDVTRALFVTVLAHFIFWVPHEVYHIVAVFHGTPFVFVVIHAHGVTRFVLDPLIFMVFAQRYRQAGLSLVRFIFCRQKEEKVEISNVRMSSTLGNRV